MNIKTTSSPGTVTLIDYMGDDRLIARTAWSSTGKDEDAETCPIQDIINLIKFLMRHKHATPFGHPHFTFLVDGVALFIVTQWLRHRTWNFSVMSFRYVLAQLRFYIPDPEHTRSQEGRVGKYRYIELTPFKGSLARRAMWWNCWFAMIWWTLLIRLGVAKEIANRVLPYNVLTRFYGTVSLRNLLNFLVLRTDENAQYEIRYLALLCEHILAEQFPITYDAWISAGRPQL